MNNNSVIIDLQKIDKFYHHGDRTTRILRAVDLQIHYGESCAIMGTSGSGKSTLMNIIGCLDRPSSGKYYLSGQAVDGLNARQLAFIRNHQIGFVFQQFYLLPEMTALENVMLPMAYGGIPYLKRFDKAVIALQKVGLELQLHRYPNQLSGGQQQRVAIARAIVNEPLLLLADEPTGALDSSTSQEVMKVLDALHHSGITVVIVTHDREVGEACQRIIQIKDGKIKCPVERETSLN
ncbi:MAG: ABC transporter ATP-binding protein [Cyanobacteria bacterium P01_C01_bin.72]